MDGGFRPTRGGLAPSVILVAEENFDTPALIRLAGWGLCALVALTVAVIAGRSELGEQRVTVAMANMSSKPGEPSRTLTMQLLARAGNVENQTRKLSEVVQALATDRDSLTNKVTSLEQSLGDVTGSIAKQSPASSIASAAPAAPTAAAAATAAAAPPPAPAAKAAPDPAAEAVPLPRANPLVATTDDPPADATEFGADFGGANTMVGLRTRWAMLKSQFGPLFEGLRPVIALHETAKGGVNLRLVVGPMANAAGAVKLCSEFTGTKIVCRPAVFDGQRLAQP